MYKMYNNALCSCAFAGSSSGGDSTGAIVGAVFAVLVALGLVAVGAFLFYKHRVKRRHDAKLEPDSPYSRNDEVYDELSYIVRRAVVSVVTVSAGNDEVYDELSYVAPSSLSSQ